MFKMPTLLLLTFFAVQSVQAWEVPFYRSQTSSFASGREELTPLFKNLKSSRNETWVRIEYDHPKNPFAQGWVREADLQTHSLLESGWWLTTSHKIKTHALPKPQAQVLDTLEAYTPVRKIESQVIVWFQSAIKEHGSVWWTDTNTYQDCLPPTQTPLNQQQIFKRKIYDMAASPINPKLKVVSANGIYITSDSQTWKRLKRFGSANHPVAFTSKGTLLIGSFMSTDEAQTFSPVFKWDKIAAKLIHHTRINPSRIRLLSIDVTAQTNPSTQSQYTAQETIEMEIGIGRSLKIKLVSKDDGKNWDVLKSVPAQSITRIL